MTGRELAAFILSLPDDQQGFDIITEGCDCHGDVGLAEVDLTYETKWIDTTARANALGVIFLGRTGGDRMRDARPGVPR
jgi:hypothetical protein